MTTEGFSQSVRFRPSYDYRYDKNDKRGAHAPDCIERVREVIDASTPKGIK